MPCPQGFDASRCQFLQDLHPGVIEEKPPGAVDALEHIEEQDELLKVGDGELVVDGVCCVGHRMGYVLTIQIIPEIVDAVTQTLNGAVLFLINAINEKVYLAPVLGEIGGGLHPDDDLVGMEFFQEQGAVDAVVVGYGDEIHSPLHRCRISLLGPAVGLPGADALKKPFGRMLRKGRMNVHVYLCHGVIPFLASRGMIEPDNHERKINIW